VASIFNSVEWTTDDPIRGNEREARPALRMGRAPMKTCETVKGADRGHSRAQNARISLDRETATWIGGAARGDVPEAGPLPDWSPKRDDPRRQQIGRVFGRVHSSCGRTCRSRLATGYRYTPPRCLIAYFGAGQNRSKRLRWGDADNFRRYLARPKGKGPRRWARARREHRCDGAAADCQAILFGPAGPLQDARRESLRWLWRGAVGPSGTNPKRRLSCLPPPLPRVLDGLPGRPVASLCSPLSRYGRPTVGPSEHLALRWCERGLGEGPRFA